MDIKKEIEELACGVGSFIGPSIYPDRKRVDFEVGPCLISYEWKSGVCECSVIDIENHQVLKTNDLGSITWDEWSDLVLGFEQKFEEEEALNYGGTHPWD
jgi:hypothetical protein